mmetsp:Transcript_24618/g.56021  ORF Transcript_24618/g.56021 Transcript_24618/m.56021 type:complete len:217 (+) Transcript_24618:43-693(+)
MALEVELRMLSGSALCSLEVPPEAVVRDVQHAVANLPAGESETSQLLEAFAVGGGDFIFGSEVVAEEAALQGLMDESGKVVLSVVIRPLPLAGKVFLVIVSDEALGEITFAAGGACTVRWMDTDAFLMISEGEFEAKVEYRAPWVTIRRSGEARRRKLADDWCADEGGHVLEGEYDEERGLRLRGWEEVSQWCYLLNEVWMQVKTTPESRGDDHSR